jgi:hypothetical protein
MPDPYAPKGWPRGTVGERLSHQDSMMVRLRDLGASDAEIADVNRTWGIDPDEDDRMRLMGDRELRAEIVAVRDEYKLGTTTEAEAAADATEAERRLILVEASERVGGTIAAVMAWVGSDPVRAGAIRALESSDDGANRKTLLAKLDEVA